MMTRLCKNTRGRERYVGDSGWRSRKKNMVISNVVKTSVSVANHMRMRIAHLISACLLDRIRDSSGAGSWRPGRLLGLDQGQAKKKAGQATRRQRRDFTLSLLSRRQYSFTGAIVLVSYGAGPEGESSRGELFRGRPQCGSCAVFSEAQS